MVGPDIGDAPVVSCVTLGARAAVDTAGRGDRIKPPHTIHDLRKWARENGHKVSPNRRAPSKVIRAFNEAH